MIIVRSVGERTTQKALEQLPGAELVENITPFSACLKECYQRAIASGDEYLVCVDADTVVNKDGLNVLIRKLKRDKSAGAALGSCKDKLTGRVRIVGITAYRVKYLPIIVPYCDGASKRIRPEKWLRQQLTKNGHKSVRSNDNIARHGYDQYYRDIWRTVIVWTRRRKNYKDVLKPMWTARADNDPDYAVALAAWDFGKTLSGIRVDAANSDGYEEMMNRLGLTEKGPL